MAFLICCEQPTGKLYGVLDDGGDILPTPNKKTATRFNEEAAEKIATEINRYASTPWEVVGAGVEASGEPETVT